MIAAGIDAALPVYWGEPTQVAQWSNEGLPPLVAARERLLKQGKRPPAIGMFYDTSTLRHNARRVHIDLTTPQGQRWFYGTIAISSRARASGDDGRPLVFLRRALAKAVDQRLFPAVRAMFRKEFGSDLFLSRCTAGRAGGSQYQWGGARAAVARHRGRGPIRSFGCARPGIIRSRDEGASTVSAGRSCWTAPASDPGCPRRHGTSCTKARNLRNKPQYIDLTRFADVSRAAGLIRPTASTSSIRSRPPESGAPPAHLARWRRAGR